MELGKVLLIGNPVAHNGDGANYSLRAEKALQAAVGENITMRMTEYPHQGAELAAASAGFDTVVLVGGDGLVHEVVNGLMKIEKENRPVLGLLPAGSGNDYARTLGMSFEIETAVDQLLKASVRDFDLGCCNGEYFAQTLSFGLDAAIALNTVERGKRTEKAGPPVFIDSGVDMLLHHMNEYEYEIEIDGWSPVDGKMYLLAVQMGVTYGGGFQICPNAIPDDGLLDFCIARPPLSTPKALLIFLLAKFALHTKFRALEFGRAQTIEITFKDIEPPIQADGERAHGMKHTISCERRALKVAVASS